MEMKRTVTSQPLLPPHSRACFRMTFISSKAKVAIRLLKVTVSDLMENMAQGSSI